MSMTINGTSGLVFNDASTQNTAATGFGFKNRIINGAMMIDQRNAGASVSINADSIIYTVDRFFCAGENADGVFSAQQDTTAPAGFKNSLKLTVTTADSSLGASQRYLFGQSIEGLNVADLGWGTASASPVTLSFWVRSSVTGTFSGSLANSAYNRCYPFSYTISVANTWEQKTVTIAGDTTGTWLTTNGVGIRAWFTIGAGSSNLGTAGAWGSTYYFGATGTTNLMATNGATFYITGVQLEKGSTATSFDYRPYGTEELLCKRYCEVLGASGAWLVATCTNTTDVHLNFNFMVQKRASPTVTITETSNWSCYSTGSSRTVTGVSVDSSDLRHSDIQLTASVPSGSSALGKYVGSTTGLIASAEL